MANKKLLFSAIVPTKEISQFLRKENLPSLSRQSYPYFECIVLPDKKSNIDKSLTEQYSWLRIIPTSPVLQPATKRDIGAKNAKGSILAFIDDDAHAAKDWLKIATKLFEKTGAEAICGPGILPKSATFWEKVFDEVLKTAVGSGGLSYRFIKSQRRQVDDYPSMNFLIKREVFQKLGGFNSSYWPGEDSKLCEDLIYKYNGKIYYDPEVYIFHHRRQDLRGYLRQHGNYGYHRGAFFAHGDKNSRQLIYIIPSLFVFYLLSLLFYALYSTPYILHPIFYIPLTIYLFFASAVFYSALKNTHSLKIALFSSIVLFLMHVVYGIQFIKGFLVGLTKKEKIYGH